MSSREYTHPAQAVITLHKGRYGGNGASLFGSDVKHNSTVTLEIHSAYHKRELNHDWIGTKDNLIEIEMSEAQFVAFVSSFGMGSGTPCTLRHVRGQAEIPKMPEPESVATKFLDDQAGSNMETVLKMKKVMSILAEMTAPGAKVSKKDLAEAYSTVGQVLNSIDEKHFKYVDKCLVERVEHLVSEAKIEVEAYVQNKLMSLGVEALKKGEGVIELPKGTE